MPGRVSLSRSLPLLSLSLSLSEKRQLDNVLTFVTMPRVAAASVCLLFLCPLKLILSSACNRCACVCQCVSVCGGVLCVTVAMKTNDKHPSATRGGKRTTDSEHGIQHETTRAKVKPTTRTVTVTEAIKATTFCCNKSLAEHETILYIWYYTYNIFTCFVLCRAIFVEVVALMRCST